MFPKRLGILDLQSSIFETSPFPDFGSASVLFPPETMSGPNRGVGCTKRAIRFKFVDRGQR